jgi:FAD/FMN-containing dehydrogenase
VEGAVLITTGRMDGVEIDPAARTARVAAGAHWQQVVDAATPVGLAPLNGSSAKVGVTGYVLGGGLSPTMGRTYGWAADHVRAIEVVTADGTWRRATPTDEPHLFWALRGAKGNFGVVTAIEIDLFPVTTYFGGGLFYAGEHTAAVLHAYREWITTAPDELNSSVALLRLPPLPEVPEPLRGRLVVHVRVCHLGSVSDGERLVAPLRAVA